MTTLEPEIVRLDFSTIKAGNDWIRLGEIVFDTPTDYDISGSPAQFRDPSYSRHGDFVPVAEDYRTVPDPDASSPFPFANGRYSDEERYSLAQFIYSLQPPKNPNAMNALAARGNAVFAREGCGTCHTPRTIPITG